MIYSYRRSVEQYPTARNLILAQSPLSTSHHKIVEAFDHSADQPWKRIAGPKSYLAINAPAL